MDENKNTNLTSEQIGEVAGGGKDDDGGKGGVTCPQCRVKNYPAHTRIRDERRFTCWRCGYSRELTDDEVDRILGGEDMSW